jgi:hypothetical protein
MIQPDALAEIMPLLARGVHGATGSAAPAPACAAREAMMSTKSTTFLHNPDRSDVSGAPCNLQLCTYYLPGAGMLS